MNNEEKELGVTEEIIEDTPQENAPEAEVPAELKGLSPEILKEAMNEIAPEEAPQDEESTEEDTGAADTDSVKKTEEPAIKKPSQKIPYERFKEVLDKNNDLKAELEALKTKMAEQPKKQPTPTHQPQQQAASEQSFRVTPEVTAQIDNAIKQQALAMCGLTAADLESIEYMDEDDARKIQYDHAKKLAEARVYNSIEQARLQQMQRQQQTIAYRNQVTNSYNNFVTQEKAAEDFDQVVDYAKGEFFESLSEEEKPIIFEAYARIEQQSASPQDIALVRRFFSDAKNSYHSKQQEKAAPKQANTTKKLETKYQQSKAFPRAQQIAGSAANTGTPSVDALERMLNELPWDEIPPEYKELVMNAGMA